MQKRKFYILGHNPNTLREAEEFLRAGANALEPDICFDAERPERFFVSHGTIGSNEFTLENSLVTYLTGLKELITNPDDGLNLALIAFDIKTPAFDINEFVRVVSDNFSRFPVCDGVAILITVGDLSDIGFLNDYDQSREDVAVGVDGEASPGAVEAGFRARGQKRFAYANGSIVPGIKFGLFKSIMAAKALQAAGGGASFGLVYAWVINSEASVRSYLDIHVDGLIVDLHAVPGVLRILGEEHFATMYELARGGHNPFAAPPPPAYLLTIKTRDGHFAGTDVPVKFTLEGSAGSLESTLDCDFKDVLERGETDLLTLEGEDVGEIRSLTVAEQDKSLNSGWLPESVRLESRLLKSPLDFHFNQDEWLMYGHPLTKTPG
jgi:hypothetical protein